MGGKPNRPKDVKGGNDTKACATDTSGLTALDQEREASLADEGGASGAAAETEEATPPRRNNKRSTRHGG